MHYSLEYCMCSRFPDWLLAFCIACTSLHIYMHNIEAVVAQELAQRVWCAVKAQKKIFWGQGPLHLTWKGMNCSICTAHFLVCLNSKSKQQITLSRFSSSKALNSLFFCRQVYIYIRTQTDATKHITLLRIHTQGKNNYFYTTNTRTSPKEC